MSKFLLTLALFLSIPVYGQDVLKNKNILEMSKSGLAVSEIISRIKNSKCDFDTDKANLKTLTDAQVDPAVISAMIEKDNESSTHGTSPSNVESELAAPEPDEQTAPEAGNAQSNINSPPFTPYSSLNKKDRKERLKKPASIKIAAPMNEVFDLLVPAFDSWGYKFVSRSDRFFVFHKPVTGYPDRFRDEYIGSERIQIYSVQVHLGELDGITSVIITGSIFDDNAFGEQKQENLSKDKKFRSKLEDLLLTIKNQAELR